MKRNKPEDALQKQILEYIRLQYRDLLVFHVPNGGSRNAIEAANLKRAGVMAGVADLIILFPQGKVLFLEVKAGKGKQSPKQVEFEQACIERQHSYEVVNSLDLAIDRLKWYYDKWVLTGFAINSD